MEKELQNIEDQLKKQCPADLGEELLQRLCDAAGGSLDRLGDEERTIGRRLAKLAPQALSDDLSERLEEVVREVPFPVDEKVLLFPRGEAREERKTKSRPWMAAAAAVALLGALSALLVNPENGSPADPVASERSTTVPASPVTDSAFMPAAFGSGVSDTQDMGVVWSNDRRPSRVLRVEYLDRVHLRNERGERVVMEVPRVEYLVVPEKID